MTSVNVFTMMFTLYKAQEPLEVEGYRGTTPSKVIILPRCKGLPEVEKKGKILERTRNPTLNRK